MNEIGIIALYRFVALLCGELHEWMNCCQAPFSLFASSIIGTPGRLMHIVMEMNLKLQNVEYVVFDEADR